MTQRIPLRSIRDIAREAARLYRAMRSGAIDSKDGARCAYVLGVLRQTIEMGDLEERIRRLEAHGDEP